MVRTCLEEIKGGLGQREMDENDTGLYLTRTKAKSRKECMEEVTTYKNGM
jgi:hypothetical protein